jgi:REP element-mobilizing transposase RayT
MTERPETISFYEGRLPHWEVAHGLYFVTISLTGSIPQAVAKSIHRMALSLEKLEADAHSELERRIFREMEEWLDKCERVQYLSEPAVAQMVMESIGHRDKEGIWNVFEYVIMPNHAHLFLELKRDTLKTAISDFKRWTGHRAAGLVNLKGKRFWQREWFDHWSRSGEQDQKIIDYIRNNPVKAGLVKDYRDWPYGSWAK